MTKNNRIITTVVTVIIILLILLGITYAYFLTQITGNKEDKSITVTTANLQLIYGDGNGVLTPANVLKPGDPVTFLDKNNNQVSSKTFTVTNNGNGYIDEYVVVLENVINNIYLRDDLTYTLTCVSVDKTTNVTKGTCKGTSKAIFPRSDEIMVTNGIDVNITHKYTLTLKYEETNEDQSIDMNKTISAKINIYDRKDKNPLLTDNNNIVKYLNNIDKLETHANDYLTANGVDPTTTGSDTYFKGKAKWLVFNFISKIDYKGGNWDTVAGPIDTGFDSYLKKKPYDIGVFSGMKYLASDKNEESGVTHFAAALVAKMYNTDFIYNFAMDEIDFDNLAGWAGDLQTLIKNNLLNQITVPNDYNHVYNTMSSLIGKTGTYFDSDDLYADIDAYNIYYLMTVSNSSKAVMEDYFKNKYKERFSIFIKKNAGSLNYDAFKENVYKYTKRGSWPLYDGVDTTKFTSNVEIASRDAFTDYIWYLANLKELNIFSHSLEFKKGKNVDFIAEYININNIKEETLSNNDYTWTVTKKDGTKSLSTINNGKLNIASNETATELLITITLNKSNKISATRLIKIS